MKERKKRECKPVDAKVRGDAVSIAIAAPEILSSFHAIMTFSYLNLTEREKIYLNYELIPMVEHV